MTVLRRLSVFMGLLVIAAATSAPAETATAAARHLRLLKSEPADGAVVESAPKAIHLWFSEAPEVRVTTIRITPPAGETRKIEDVTVDSEDAKHLIAPTGSVSPVGEYRVTWRTMSLDGHVVNGAFAYRIAPRP